LVGEGAGPVAAAYAPAGAAAKAGLSQVVSALTMTADRLPEAAPLLEWHEQRPGMAAWRLRHPNVDYRTYAHPLTADTLYFHAQYRQAQPNNGWTNKWTSNGDPLVNDKANLDGKNNSVWMEATGHGQYVGVTMSVL